MLKHKILMLYVCISMFILIILGSFVSSALRKVLIGTISKNYHKQLEHIDFGLNIFFENIEHDLENIAKNETVRAEGGHGFTNFLDADEKTFRYDIGETEQKIITIFNRYRNTHPYVHSVSMGRENGDFVRSHKRARPTRYDPRTRSWYVLGKENPGKIMRTPPFRSVTTPDVNIGFVKALLDDEKNPFGVLGIFLTLTDLMHHLGEIEMDYKGSISLVDESGTILVARDQSFLFKNLAVFNAKLNRDIFEASEGFSSYEMGAEKQYAFFYTSPSLQWKLAVIVPVSEIEHVIWSVVYKILAVLVAGLLLLSLLTLLGLRRFVIKPITKLDDGVHHIARTGDLSQKIDIESSDEIGHLAKHFNEMINSLGESEKALKESEKKLIRHRDHLEDLVEERTVELKTSQKRLSQIIDFLPDPTWVVDNDGKVVTWNRALENLLGIKAKDMIGKGDYEYALPFYGTRRPVLIDLIREWDAGYEKEYLSVKKEDNILLSESYHPHLGDGGMYLAATAGLLYSAKGDIVGAIESLRDITDTKRMQKDLVAAKKSADEANKAKSDFLANMSHEIRTPMNAVIGMTHLALKTELTSKQKDYLDKIQSSANSLLGIINDILDFSKIEAGKLDMESVEFNLDDVLDNLANLVTVKAGEKEELEVLIATAPDVPRHLVGDPLRLGQILINLANNAVKFTEAGEIVISTEVDSRQDDDVMLQFSVRDTGIGLTEEQMDKLFESFSQADTSTTRKYGGTGLGLSISKRLVEMMDGKIWVESEYGRGATFNFLARFGIGREKLKKRFEGSQDLKGMKVLVVDDNATSRNILNDILESFSFEVHLASTGEDGLEELEKADPESPFDLVLMDWKMPGMDGLEASRKIKTHPHLEKIPAVVMVTAYGREELMQRSERLGLEGFLIKPVNPSVLFDTILEALGQKSSITPQRRLTDAGEISGEIRGAHVLLAEDNEINQQVAYEILQGAGLKVSVVDNGLKAVKAVKSNRYDAVLMDIQMPVMDGHAATREIRNWESKIQNPNSRIENIPIIAMTAHAMAGDEAKSLQAGMNGHVTKPIDPDQLFAVLAKWISPTHPTPQEGGSAAAAVEVQTTEEGLPESLPGFDLETGLKRLGGNRKLYRKLLVDFGSQYDRTSDEIRVALDCHDYKQAHSLVHNLKGLAGNLEAGDLLSATLEMEALVKAGHENAPVQEELDASFVKLRAALDQALAAVQTLGPGVQEESPSGNDNLLASVPPEVVRSAADRIKAAADIGDVTQISDIANELKATEKALASYCGRILRLADDFDLDGILKLVDEMIA